MKLKWYNISSIQTTEPSWLLTLQRHHRCHDTAASAGTVSRVLCMNGRTTKANIVMNKHA